MTASVRLVVAAGAALSLHAAVFGAAEIASSRGSTQSAQPPDHGALTVAVSLQPAPQPEPLPPPIEVPQPALEPPATERPRPEPELVPTPEPPPTEAPTETPATQPATADPQPESAVPTGATRPVAALPSEPTEPDSAQGSPAAATGPQGAPVVAYRYYAAPRYPEAARLEGHSGSIVLEVSINRRGRVVGVDILSSSSHEILDQEAVRTARLWRFERGADDRLSVHTIRFELEE